MNNKVNNGYPYDAAQSAAYQQYMNSQIPAHAQLPPSYSSVMTSMTPAGYSPYPPGLVHQQPFYAANGWSVNPSAPPPAAAPMQFAPSHLPPPPPYAAAVSQPSGTITAIPTQTVVHPGTMYQYQIAAGPPTHQGQPQQVYHQTPIYPVQGAMYDAGARFGKTGGSASIPPPPPGIAPNAAQMAAMQGQQVVMTKKKNNFLHGGNGAGFTFW
ncbi:DAZ-associated protein 2 [Uranotaenia lowii]|uniref:DAZ-associated protein 2 n=1 Tax=Uranotaenia lowii TaxID=190385 RepID=UPI00247872EF|nr:DAZ-associated protein 2 [Uranotaenia lowii]